MKKKLKIFLTVGTHPMQFNRLVKMADEQVKNHPLKYEIVAQIGVSSDEPKHIQKWFRNCDFNEFRDYIKWADIIISHAGAGNIITALSYKKPIIIVPRLGDLGEHTNNHQLELAEKFKNVNGVFLNNSDKLIINFKTYKVLKVSGKEYVRLCKMLKNYLHI